MRARSKSVFKNHKPFETSQDYRNTWIFRITLLKREVKKMRSFKVIKLTPMRIASTPTKEPRHSRETKSTRGRDQIWRLILPNNRNK